MPTNSANARRTHCGAYGERPDVNNPNTGISGQTRIDQRTCPVGLRFADKLRVSVKSGVFAEHNQKSLPLDLRKEYLAVGRALRANPCLYFFDSQKLV